MTLILVSGRWFSILREDDADYLSSRWLSQDCAEKGEPGLEDYINFQIAELKEKKWLEESQSIHLY